MKYEKPPNQPEEDLSGLKAQAKVNESLGEQSRYQFRADTLLDQRGVPVVFGDLMSRLERRLNVVRQLHPDRKITLEPHRVIWGGEIGDELSDLSIELFEDPVGAPPQPGVEDPVLGLGIRINSKEKNRENFSPVEEAFRRQFHERAFASYSDAMKNMRNWLTQYKNARDIK